MEQRLDIQSGPLSTQRTQPPQKSENRDDTTISTSDQAQSSWPGRHRNTAAQRMDPGMQFKSFLGETNLHYCLLFGLLSP